MDQKRRPHKTNSHPPASAKNRDIQENQRLKARITQLESRNLALAGLLRHLMERRKKLEARVNEGVRLLDERAKTIDRLQGALTTRDDGRLRMCESYEGEVVDVRGDRVVVVYDVDGNVVEQTYERRQFLDGRLPEADTDLVAYVIVADTEPRTGGAASEADAERDEVSGSRREPLAGPTEF
jgi:hypothetical protein